MASRGRARPFKRLFPARVPDLLSANEMAPKQGPFPLFRRLVLVATALSARDRAAVRAFDRRGHHAAVSPRADGEPIVRLILDGTVVRVRLDRKATSISLLVVIGVREGGQTRAKLRGLP